MVAHTSVRLRYGSKPLLCLLAALVSCFAARAADDKKPDEKPAGAKPAIKTVKPVDLFNGKNLDGWKVTECEVAVENGSLVLKSGEGFVWVDHRYRDFILELDWKTLKEKDYDSGVYIRSELPAAGKHWPARYQMNLKEDDEGDLLGIKGAKPKLGPIKKGDWNHFKLTVVGASAELEINDKPAWKADGLQALDGYIGFQSECTNGGQHEFRNIRITELSETGK